MTNIKMYTKKTFTIRICIIQQVQKEQTKVLSWICVKLSADIEEQILD